MRYLRWQLILAAAALMAGCTSPLKFSPSAALVAIPAAQTPQSPLPETPQPAPAPAPAKPAPAKPSPAQAKPTPPPTPDFGELQGDLKGYLDQQEGTYGVYVIDLASGKGIGINENSAFPTASTFKLPMAMYILNQVDEGKVRLDEELAYSAGDYEEGTGTLQGSISEGDTMTVKQLLELAITQSDNIATNMLLDRFGRDNVFAYMKSLGGKVTWYQDDDISTTGTTPKEMATYMRLVYNKQAIADAKLRQMLLDWLTHTAFDDRTAAGVPNGVKVAHKIGTLPNVVNDVALVYAPNRTFVVAVYSTGVEEDTAADVIAELTRRVYGFEHAVAVTTTPASAGEQKQGARLQ